MTEKELLSIERGLIEKETGEAIYPVGAFYSDDTQLTNENVEFILQYDLLELVQEIIKGRKVRIKGEIYQDCSILQDIRVQERIISKIDELVRKHTNNEVSITTNKDEASRIYYATKELEFYQKNPLVANISMKLKYPELFCGILYKAFNETGMFLCEEITTWM